MTVVCAVTTAGHVDTSDCSHTCYRMRITRYICSTAPASLEPQSERLLLWLVKRRTPYRMRGNHRQSIHLLSLLDCRADLTTLQHDTRRPYTYCFT